MPKADLKHPTENESVGHTTPQEKTSLRQRWGAARRTHKIVAILGVLCVFMLTLAVVLGAVTYSSAKKMQTQATAAQATAGQVYSSFKNQNLPETAAHIQTLKTQLDEIEHTYSSLGVYSAIPVARTYYIDGTEGIAAARAGLAAAEKSIAAMEPYADVLGFSGESSFEGGTIEDRLAVLLQTLDKVNPELDAISVDLGQMDAYLAQIDESNYPDSIRGQPVKEYIVQAKELSAGAHSALSEFRPVINQLPSVAGATEGKKKYLVLFQNDNELRPTGGFLTAYAIISVENGKVEAEKSDDIYELDQQYRATQDIPEKLGKYLTTESAWNLRDMNISPDFATSMDQFYTEYQTVSGEEQDIDGIIAIDTEFLLSLITLLGPVDVPGYGTFSAETVPACDCPQIIYALSEIITRPTPYLRTDRKGVLGPMMREILNKAYSTPKQQWPELFQTGFASIEARHAQFYFFDEETQAAAATINATGALGQQHAGSDYFALVNANLGGAKSNLFVTYDVKQSVSAPENGKVTKTVEITYKNSRKADNCNLEAGLLCLNATLQDWTRIYVPEGAELISTQGFENEPELYAEAGFSVIDGFFTLEPLGIAKLQVTYSIPYQNGEEYELFIRKQGGIKEFELFTDVNGTQEKQVVSKDTVVTAPF